MPLGMLLVGVAHPQHGRLIEGFPKQLHTHRQSQLTKAARGSTWLAFPVALKGDEK